MSKIDRIRLTIDLNTRDKRLLEEILEGSTNGETIRRLIRIGSELKKGTIKIVTKDSDSTIPSELLL